MDSDNNRVLLTLEQHRKTINREKINAEVEIQDVSNIQPVLTMVAELRAAYVKALFEVANDRDGLPTSEHIDKLTQLRNAYSEVVDAANAMEIAIERGYVDVKSV